MSGGVAHVDVDVPIYDFQSRQLLHYASLQPGADLTDYIHTLSDGRTGTLCVAPKLDALDVFEMRAAVTFDTADTRARCRHSAKRFAKRNAP